MKKQTGFTIIELIVVIALLGILAAVALPRFINLTHEAHNAAVEGVAGGLAAGVVLARARAFVSETAPGGLIQLEGVELTVNGNGFPIGGVAASNTTTTTQNSCVDVWNGVLQGSRPVVSTAIPADSNNVAYQAQSASGGETCEYTYKTPNTQTPGVNTPRMVTYNTVNGNVTVTGTEDE